MRRLMKNIFKRIDNMQLFCEREAVCTHTGPLCNYSSNNAYALNSDVRCLSIILKSRVCNAAYKKTNTVHASGNNKD